MKYHETCKVAMENLMAEKEARQELLAKYLKSVEAAAVIFSRTVFVGLIYN